jgi:hypothetical protein
MRKYALFLAGTMVVVGAACAAEEGLPPPTVTQVQAEQAEKAIFAPASVVTPIDWRAARAALPRLQSALSPQQRATLEGLPMPALLPDDALLLGAAHISRGPHWYAASIHLDNHSIYLHGSHQAVRVARGLPGAQPATAARDPRIIHNQGMATATWSAHGAAYRLTVGCYDPTNDVRCTGDEYVRTLTGMLALAEVQP